MKLAVIVLLHAITTMAFGQSIEELRMRVSGSPETHFISFFQRFSEEKKIQNFHLQSSI